MNVNRDPRLLADLVGVGFGTAFLTLVVFAGALVAGLSVQWAAIYAVAAGLIVVPTFLEETDLDLLLERGDVDVEERIAELRERYVEGELTLEQFSLRAEIVLDPERCIVRDELEEIDGIGPETSTAIAARFATIDDVQEASRDELEDVDGVGPATSEAIRESLVGAVR